MDYIEIIYRLQPETEIAEILMAHLAEIGFEMFEEKEEGLKAYIPAKEFTAEIESDLVPHYLQSTIQFTKNFIKHENWNTVWESNFKPEIIAEKIYVRADFHTPQPQYPYEIIIQPKMAFGTGHHPTTALVMEQMLSLDIINKTVLDMGCGTGILAVLAEKLGAVSILAIDNDENAVSNARENVIKNSCYKIAAVQGDATTPGNQMFDVVIANINRNIILNDLPLYVVGLNAGGDLLLSGFYEKDLAMIQECAEKNNLLFQNQLVKNEWCCAYFKKVK